jgi:hypothetical protein
MITLKQASALQSGDRISYTPTPLPGDPQEATQLGTVTSVLPAFTMAYRTVPARLLITWDTGGQAAATIDWQSQDFWDYISILD